MAILVRSVQCTHNHTDTELFVTLKDGMLCLPSDIPKRFEKRLHATESRDILHVDSLPFDCPTVVTRQSLAVKGMWITRDDAVPRGEVSARVFGIPLHAGVLAAWSLIPLRSDTRWRIRVGYHGTDEACMQSIARDNTLRPSFGQLGTGVYTGSFWKACRFAVRDQNYTFKTNPCVLRVLWLCDTTRVLSFPRETACSCNTFCVGKSVQEAQACGHDLVWTDELAWQTGELLPFQLSNGRWMTRNEEWICSPASIQRLQQFAFLDVSTVDGPQYNPMQRDIQIL